MKIDAFVVEGEVKFTTTAAEPLAGVTSDPSVCWSRRWQRPRPAGGNGLLFNDDEQSGSVEEKGESGCMLRLCRRSDLKPQR